MGVYGGVYESGGGGCVGVSVGMWGVNRITHVPF
jgi:hypothetical protein